MDKLERFSRLVAKIQQTPLEPWRWPQVLKAIASEVGASTSVMFSQDAPPSLGGFWASDTYVPEDMENYAAHFADKNVWLQSIENTSCYSAGGEAFVSDAFISPGEMRRTEFYNYFLKPLEIGKVLGCVLSSKSRKLVPSEIHLSLLRPLEKAAFSDAAQKTFQLLVPHLQAALKTHYALSMNQSHLAGHAAVSGIMGMLLTAEAFNALPFASLVLSPKGKVLFANDAAVRMFERADGVFVRNGTLQGADASSTSALHRFMAKLFAGVDDGFVHVDYVHHIQRLSGRKPYVCMGYPLSPATEIEGIDHVAGNRTTMLLIRDPEKDAVPAWAELKNRYDMTEAEVEITQALASGMTIREIGNHRHVSYHTVRSQVKAIFQKTGCHRQAELMTLILKK